MPEDFFAHPILNSPYEYPARHWELDKDGQPTNRILDRRRRAEFITPIPKPKKRRAKAQQEIVFDEGEGLSTDAQQYDPTPVINEIRHLVDQWRELPNPADWRVTPATAQLLKHWRHPDYSGTPARGTCSSSSASRTSTSSTPTTVISRSKSTAWTLPPQTGEVRSDGAEGIACWFIDTNYDEESFFVRHSHFLAAGDTYKSLKSTLKAEIDEEAWESPHSDTSRPFEKPQTGRIAVKVSDHLGDEVMKVFRV